MYYNYNSDMEILKITKEIYKKFEKYFYIDFNKIIEINNFYTKFLNHPNVKKINSICNELKEPLLYKLTIIIRAWKKEIFYLLQWISKDENKKIYNNKDTSERWNMNNDFSDYIYGLFKDKKLNKNIFDQTFSILNAVSHCHRDYPNSKLKNEIKNSDSKFNEILSDEKLINNFFKFNRYIYFILHECDPCTSAIQFKYENNNSLIIMVLEKYFDS